ncbi:MAG: hypothetical protein CVU43_02430 [Chloroflexi bacterium HGW-Chloroflexi-5]|jgi:transcriptional regulator with XRE-family HTH domain|nr:MAG: hypothetical protein CVU43_02430 [Chloroflexi bacterium HGW-Chloroflexi-5]
METDSKFFPKWLFTKYVTWQQEIGSKKTIREFANWLDLSPSIISLWLKGKRTPSISSASRIAKRLGSEVFDIIKADEEINSSKIIIKVKGVSSKNEQENTPFSYSGQFPGSSLVKAIIFGWNNLTNEEREYVQKTISEEDNEPPNQD